MNSLIDFEYARIEWNANKKKTPTGYKYLCSSTIGKTTTKCRTVCYQMSDYCYAHRGKCLNLR